jgi:hypothetical protein
MNLQRRLFRLWPRQTHNVGQPSAGRDDCRNRRLCGQGRHYPIGRNAAIVRGRIEAGEAVIGVRENDNIFAEAIKGC